MKNRTQSLVKLTSTGACLLLALLARNAGASNQWWDNNGASTPTSGTWDTTTANWTTSASSNLTASTVPFTNGNFAEFAAGSGTITSLTISVPGAVTCAGMASGLNAALVNNLTFSGTGSIGIVTNGGTSLNGYFVQGIYCDGASGGNFIFNVPLTGAGGVQQHGNGYISLVTNNSYAGGTALTGGQVIYYYTTASFGTGPIYVGGTGNALLNNTSPDVSLTIPNNFTFPTAGYNINLAGGNPVSGAPGTTFTGTFTLPSSGTTTINTSSTSTEVTEISGVVSGASALNVADAGTLELAGVNTYTGATIISNTATLSIIGSGSLGGGTYAGTLANNSVFVYASSTPQTLSGVVSGSGLLDVASASALTLKGVNTFTNAISNAGTLTLSGAGSLTSGSYSGKITNNGTITYNSSASQTLSGVISGAGALNQAGSGALTLSGANTYTGLTTITGGYLLINADTGLGAAPSSAVANQLTINGGTGSTTPTGLRFNANNITLSANRGITLGANGGSIGVSVGATCTIPGVITGTGNFQSAFSYNTSLGTLKLTGANNYTGATTIAGGVLQLGASGTLPAGTPLTILPDNTAGGVLDLNGFNQTIGPLATGAGISAGTNAVATPSIKLSGALTILQTNVSTSFGGIINGVGGSLTISVPNGGTPGKLTLTNVNIYTGPTIINAGTLALGSTGSIINSTAISIAAGATFDVSAIASYSLSSRTALQASGAGTTQGTTAAAINGAASGTVNLGSQPIYLGYTPSSPSGDLSDPALEILQGALTLNNNQLVVTNLNASPLGAGVYNLIQVGDGTAGTINNAPLGPVVVVGNGLAAGYVATASISGSTVVMTVSASANNTTSISLSSANPTYGATTLSATVSPTPDGGTVQFFNNGVPVGSSAAVNTTTGVATVVAGTLPAGSYNNITAIYSGDSNFGTCSASLGTTLTVGTAPLTVTVNAQSTPYGLVLTPLTGNTQFTATPSNSETIGTVALTLGGAGYASTNTPAGTYSTAITPGSAAGGTFNAANYTITYVAGALTVNPVPLTITASAQSKSYGTALTSPATLQTANFTAAGLSNGQTTASMTVTLTYTGAAANAAVASSPYAITPSAVAEAASATNFSTANYNITYVAGNLSVTQLVVKLTGSQPYNGLSINGYGVITAPYLKVSNAVSGDTVYAAEGVSLLAGINPGTYTFASLSTEILGNAGGQGTGTGVGINAQFNAPAGLCVDIGGNLYVADTANNRVCEITPAGVQTVVPFTGLNNPVGVAVDVNSNIYVVCPSQNAVFEMPAGGTQTTAAFTGLNYPSAITVDQHGDVFVADTLNSRVVELPYGGSQTTVAGLTVSAPAGLTVDTNGDLFVVSAGANSVVELPAGGSQKALTGLTNYSYPVALAVDNYTNVYLASYGSGNVRMLSLGAASPLLTTNAFVNLNEPVGVAVDANGNVFAADTGHNRLEVLGGTGLTNIGTLTSNNYTLAGASLAGPVTNTATPTYSGLTSSTITYGASSVTLPGALSGPGPTYPASGTIITATINGNAQTNAISGSAGAFSITYKTTNLPASATPYTIAYTSAASTNGVFNAATNTSTTITVNPLPVVLTGARQYDGTNDAAAGILTVSNPVGSDVVNVASGVGVLAAANVGSEAITSTGTLALGGAAAGDYTLAGASGAVTVSPAALTYTAVSASTLFGSSALPGFSGMVTGFVGGDTQASATTGALTFTSPATAASPAGSYPIYGSGLSANNGNYTFAQAAGNATALTITPIGVTIVSGLTVSNLVYDGTNAASLTVTNTVVLAGLASGDASGVTVSTNGYVATFATSNVNSNITVTVAGLTLTGGDATNYTLTQPVFTADITPAPVTILGGLTVEPVTYGTLIGLEAATLSSNNVVLAGVLDQDTNGVSLDTNGYTAVFTDTNANLAVPVTVSGLSLSGSEATNYSLVEPSLTGTIGPAPLTYVAFAASQAYGSDNTNFTGGEVTGFVYQDDLAGATSGTLVFTSTTTAASPIGSYALAGGGLTASNYVFLQAPGNATALTIYLGGGGTTYPGNVTNNSTFSYNSTGSQTVSGVVSGTGSVNVSGSGTLTLTAPNTYTGATTISSGTLALGSGGSISNTSGVSIGSGGTLDVSALPAASTFTMPGANFTASGDAPATIIGPLDGFVNLGSLPITLTNDGVGPSLTIEQSTLVLDGNVFTIDTFSGSPLAPGNYVVIEQETGDISGSISSSVTGTAIPASGTTNFVAVSGGDVVLSILNNTTTTLSGNSNSFYGSPLSITATVSPTSPDGEAVVFYAGASPIATNTTVGGVASLSISTLPVGGYAITADYSGDSTNAPSASGPFALTVNVSQTPINLSYSLTGNQLTLSWPADHLGWTLQTNSAGLSFNGSWFAYPGSTATNSETITIQPDQGGVYFRLVSQ